MKNSLLLAVLLFLTAAVVRLRGNFVRENERVKIAALQEFLDSIRQIPDVISRRVFVGDEESSLEEYITAAASERDGAIDAWTITRVNVLGIAHMMNVVVSCEYGAINYNYTKLVENLVRRLAPENADLRAVNERLERYKLFVSQHVVKHTAPIVLTLAGLVKFAKHYVSRDHEVLRALLSWYAFMEDRHVSKWAGAAEQSLESKTAVLDSISLVAYQTRNRLEQFMVKNCYRPEALADFRDQVDRRISETRDLVDRDPYLEETDGLLSAITRPSLVAEDEEKWFIFNAPSTLERLTAVLDRELEDGTSSLTRMVRLKDEENLDWETVVVHEQLLLDTIVEIISSYEWTALKDIAADESVSDKHGACVDRLSNVLDEYVPAFAAAGHPAYLLNAMTAKRINAFYACSLLRSPDTNRDRLSAYMEKLDDSKANRFEGTDFRGFLHGLSAAGVVVCAAIHPAIFDTLAERDDYYATMRNECGADFFPRFSLSSGKRPESPRRTALCRKLSEIGGEMDAMVAAIDRCSASDATTTAADGARCFQTFDATHDAVIGHVCDVVSNCTDRYDFAWDSLAFTLVYNKPHVRSFEPGAPGETRLRHLRTFAYAVRLAFRERHRVVCGSGNDAVSEPESLDVDKCALDSPKAVAAASLDQLKRDKRFKGCFVHEAYFENLRADTRRLVDESPDEARSARLPWGGEETTLARVQDRFESRPYDLLAAFDYYSYAVKWKTALVYSGLMDVIDGQLEAKDFRLDEDVRQRLRTSVDEFLVAGDDSLQKPAVTGCLATAAALVGWYFDADSEDAVRHARDTLAEACEFLGFTEQPSRRAGNVSQRLDTLFSRLELVRASTANVGASSVFA